VGLRKDYYPLDSNRREHAVVMNLRLDQKAQQEVLA
jgi:hypothetical protein